LHCIESFPKSFQMKAIAFFFFVILIFINGGDSFNSHMRGSEDRNLYSLNDNTKVKTHVFKERIAGLRRPDLVKLSRISPETDHEVIFVIKQRNLEELKSILHDVSDPSSINYGKHKTRQEVADLTANFISRDYLVLYLASIGATVLSETLDGEYVTANAPIRLWEEIFHTEFFMFHQTQDVDRIKKFVRAEHYYLPVLLDTHVESVFNTVQMPIEMFGRPILSPEPRHNIDNRSNKKETKAVFKTGFITADKLKVRSNGHYQYYFFQ
jgi:subtilase family serine protease